MEWSRPVQAEYAFKTFVKRSFDGTEQRQALRQEPRVTIQHRVVNMNGRSKAFAADLAHRPDDIFSVPVGWRRASVDARNFRDFRLTEVPFWAVEGAEVVVESETDVDEARIASVAGNTVTLDRDPPGVYPNGSRMFHAHRARMEPVTELDFLTSEVSSGSVTWVVEPGAGLGAFRPVTPETFNARDAFIGRPDWSRPAGFRVDTRRATFDPGLGLVDVRNPHRYSLDTMQFDFTEMTQEDVDALVSFFVRQKGMQSSFYMPTWRSDIPHIGSDGSGNIRIEGTDFARVYGDHNLYAAVAVSMPDGSLHMTRAGSIRRHGEQSVLEPETPLPEAIGPEARVSWLPRVRFAADRLKLEWLSGRVGRATVSVTAVPLGG